MIAYDFFCGGGGLTRGLLDAGIQVVAGLDQDEGCRRTYEFNNPGVEFVRGDIRAVQGGQMVTVGNTDDLLFAACAPCQPFSKQGRGPERRRDAALLCEFARLVGEVLPGYVLVENVAGITKVPGFSAYRRFLRVLRSNGYQWTAARLNAKHYGVPQNRWRLVVLAARKHAASLPAPTHGRQVRPIRTVREAIAHFPAIRAGESHPDVANHTAAALSELNARRLRATAPDGGDRRSWPNLLRLDCHQRVDSGYTDVYGRMYWNRPAPTLTSRCDSLSNGRYGHPEQDRAISLREAAALQTFGDRYVFYGTKREIASQIGNAVPVRLAWCVGKHLQRLRERGSSELAVG